MKTALGRVLGLGSARSGTDDFVKDRIRAVFLLILTPYVIGVGIWLAGRPHAEVVEGLSSPFVSLPLGIYLLLAILHMRLGVQTIIDTGLKLALTLLNLALCGLLAVAILFSILKLMLATP